MSLAFYAILVYMVANLKMETRIKIITRNLFPKGNIVNEDSGCYPDTHSFFPILTFEL